MPPSIDDLTDGPVNKPRREPIEKPEPRPKGPVNQPAPPRPAPPTPRPTPPPPPEEGPIDRGPIQKPRREPIEKPLPTTLPGPIGDRWRQLGGLSWGQPTSEPETLPGGRGGKAVSFMLPGLNNFATIIWRAATGAVLVNPTMLKAYNAQQGTRGPLGLPTAEQAVTHDGVGRYQTFDGGVIVWHPSIGAFSVFGDIHACYAKVGGSAYGYPVAEQKPLPDGRAWVQEFREVASGAERSIYWTPEYRAQPLFGAIRDAWRSYRGYASLGYPKTGEMALGDGGVWQRFENADYIWHPSTGAHEVHGDVAAVYHQMGGSTWGYPTTDETKTPDGVGRFNHFRNVGGGWESSIYWTPDTGAQPVYGLIRQRWAELGWERSHLGYPTGPEVDWPEGGTGSRKQAFQRGEMLYRADHNQAGPNPIDLLHDFGKDSQLQGWVRARIFADGRVEHSGHQRATGANSYSFGIQVAATTGTVGVANAWEGKVKGTFESGSRNAEWFEASQSPAVVTAFWDLQSARLDVQRYKDKSLGWVSGVLESSLKFLLGSGAAVVLGPAGATLIVVGTLAGSAISGGNVQAGLRILNGTLWMAGPGGTFIALLAEGIAQLATSEREMRDDEWEVASLVFGSQLPARSDIRITDAVGGGERPFVFKRFDGKVTINMGRWKGDPLGMKQGELRDKNDPGKGTFVRGEKFVHELVHAWQLEHGSDLMLVLQGMGKVFGEQYDYDAGKPFRSYNLEQQGKIVQDWFRANYTPGIPADGFGLSSARATGHGLYPYIRDNIRSGTGSAL